MKIKILRIIARLNIGGPARNAVLLADALSSKINVGGNTWETVLVCGKVDDSEGDMMYLAEQKGIKPIVIEELGREISWKDDLIAFWKIFRIICREKPDIIHTHTAKAGTLGRLAGILYNFSYHPLSSFIIPHRPSSSLIIPHRPSSPLIIPHRHRALILHTFHGHVLHSYFGRFKTIFFIWIEKILSFFTDKIITVSEALKKELVEKYRIATEEKFSVIELGFELDELLKLPLRENTGMVNIGIVGRLAPIKNHKMLLRILKGLESKFNISCNARNVKLAVIGDGEMQDELKKYTEELSIGNIVEFKGWIKDLRAIYDGLDIVVLTSLNEGTPVSLIEAMAAGKPVMATKTGGVPDIVQDGKNGYMAESWDEEGFSQKLMNLIENPVKRKDFGNYGRDIVKLRFAKERLIKDTEKLYNELVSLHAH